MWGQRRGQGQEKQSALANIVMQSWSVGIQQPAEQPTTTAELSLAESVDPA